MGDLGTDLFDAYDAVTAIEDAGGTANLMLVNPTDWAVLARIAEASGSDKPVLWDIHDAAAGTLAGVPVLVHRGIPSATALMLETSEVVSGRSCSAGSVAESTATLAAPCILAPELAAHPELVDSLKDHTPEGDRALGGAGCRRCPAARSGKLPAHHPEHRTEGSPLAV